MTKEIYSIWNKSVTEVINGVKEHNTLGNKPNGKQRREHLCENVNTGNLREKRPPHIFHVHLSSERTPHS